MQTLTRKYEQVHSLITGAPKRSVRERMLSGAPASVQVDVNERNDRLVAFAGVDSATEIMLEGAAARIVPLREEGNKVICAVMRRAGNRWGYTPQRIIIEKHA